MPSGPKKRKANKKKKENQSNDGYKASAASDHSHGDADATHHDGKVSEVHDDRSSASQDHQSPLVEGREEAIKEGRVVYDLPSDEGSRIDSGENHIAVEESIVQVENELDKRGDRIDQDEAVRKPCHGGSSDDESRCIKNSRAEFVLDSVVDSVKVSDSLSRESAEAIHTAPIRVTGDSVVENVLYANSEMISVLGEQIDVDVNYPAENSVAPCLIESGLQQNGETSLVSGEKEAGTSVSSLNAALESEDKEVVCSVENTAMISDRTALGNEARFSVPHKAAKATADTGAEHDKESGITESLLVPSPYAIEKTSSKSCCGLFELFSRSGS